MYTKCNCQLSIFGAHISFFSGSCRLELLISQAQPLFFRLAKLYSPTHVLISKTELNQHPHGGSIYLGMRQVHFPY